MSIKHNLILLLALLIQWPAFAAAPEKQKLMWIDLSGMWTRFNNPDTVDYYMDRIVDCGFNTVIIDVKGTGSAVGYPSEVAPQLLDWKGLRIDPSHDYLATVLASAKKRGLTAYAAFNIFCEGKPEFKRGILHGDTLAWRAMNYLPGQGIVPAPENEGPGTSFCNPALPEVQAYEQKILMECVARYPGLDGIMVDRCRYDNLTSDFSDFSRREFEKYAGTKVERFPEDIYEWKDNGDGTCSRVDGPLFKKWIEWRAKVIHDFFASTRDRLRSVRPDIKFGAYTGAWYPSYYEVGVNWAAPDFNPSQFFDWATEDYSKYSFADLLDLYTNGNYYKTVTLDEYRRSNPLVKNETDTEFHRGEYLCVEGACRYSRAILNGRPFVGGMYVVDYDTDVEKFKEAVKMNMRESDGLMVFELAHIIRTGWFGPLRDAIAEAEAETTAGTVSEPLPSPAL